MKTIFKLLLTGTLIPVLTMLQMHGIHLRAQSLEPFNPYGIFSPSVEAWQMTRYGNLTPSLYTGAMTYSVPLYTYEDLDFTIPISLEYSFDGYRPGQHSGTVGYGWYLNCGGVITREVQGIPDEGVIDQSDYSIYRVAGWISRHDSTRFHGTTFNGYYGIRRREGHIVSPGMAVSMMQSYNPFTDIPMETFSEGSNNWMYDPAPDIWHFRFLGHSGDFIIGNDGKAIVYNSDIPGGEITISFHNIEPTPYNSNIIITTGDGTEYIFSVDGYSEAHSSIANTELDVSESLTSWRLSRISATNGRSVRFINSIAYSTTSMKRYDSETHGRSLDNSLFPENEPVTEFSTSPYSSPRWSVTKEEYTIVSDIVILAPDSTKEAEISFSYSNANCNENSTSCFDCDANAIIDTGAQKLLSDIVVYNNARDVVESVHLTYQQATNGVPKSFLSSVSTGVNGRWSFDYNLTGYALPKNDTQSTDHWGFWNGKNVVDLLNHLTECRTIVLHEAYDEYVLEGDSLVLHHVPAETTHGTSLHLYDQIYDSAKDADWYYGSCGALTKIIYPTGGETIVEYEPNQVSRRLNAYRGTNNVVLENVDAQNVNATLTVGGVRVKSLSDVDKSGNVFKTKYEYKDSCSRCSGILMQMPKYADRAMYHHLLTGSLGNLNTNCTSTVQSLVFSNSCGSLLSRDGHVAYQVARIVHPDGSSTIQEFTTTADSGFEDVRNDGSSLPKHVICDIDTITPIDTTEVRTAPVNCDSRGLRGRIKRVSIYDVSGNEVKRTENTYSYRLASVSGICVNSPYEYKYLQSYTSCGALLVSCTETLYGVTKTSNYTHNALGQIVQEETIHGTGTSADTLRMSYTYLHESMSPAWFTSNPALRSAKSSAQKFCLKDGIQQIVAFEEYTYGDNGNPRPIQILSYPSGNTSSPRSISFTYDSRFRIISSLERPGGKIKNFSWSGNNLEHYSLFDGDSNGFQSTTSYLWKDLVGPIQITEASGRSTNYGYDANSRLSTINDTKGNPVAHYDYSLKNE